MKVPTYEPLNTLKKVGPNIWIADGDIIQMDFIFFDVSFSTRMTVVKFDDGTLWCHSPIKPSTSLFREIRQLGEVRHLISPNKLHYAYIGEWKKSFPEAITWASPDVEERARSQKIDVVFDRALDEDPPSYWSSEIDQLIFRGSRMVEEVVFFHKKSQTLIIADLIENFEPKRTNNLFLKWLYKIGGIADPDGKMPVDLRMTFAGRKERARQAYQRMLAWQPEKIILAHGRWYPENGTAELKRAFRWLDK